MPRISRREPSVAPSYHEANPLPPPAYAAEQDVEAQVPAPPPAYTPRSTIIARPATRRSLSPVSSVESWDELVEHMLFRQVRRRRSPVGSRDVGEVNLATKNPPAWACAVGIIAFIFVCCTIIGVVMFVADPNSQSGKGKSS